MEGTGKLGRALHEEHFWTLVVMTGLEERVTNGGAETPLDPRVPADREQLEELRTVLQDMMRHHAFEEAVLFPALWSRGAQDITVLFTRDHATIGPLTKRVRNDTEDLLAGGADDALWERFKEGVLDLAAQVMVHLQKEELAIVRRLGSMLGERLDHELAERFLAEKDADKARGRPLPALGERRIRSHA